MSPQAQASRAGIVRTFARHRIRALPAARFGFASRVARREVFARATREALEELGPSFIKLGQLVSVRPDVFPAELVFELSLLRDAAPPLDPGTAEATIAREFGREAGEIFEHFDPVPVAAASIAQVHRARLRDDVRPAWGETLAAGTRVAVKVVRPGIRAVVAADIAQARDIARRFPRVGSLARVDVGAFLDEFEAAFACETDMRLEGRMADRFAFDFRHDERIRVPRVAWPLTSRRVLTMEYLEGWRLSDLDEATRAGIDAEGLARHGAIAFMRQVLLHGRFHADLHPANLFVTPDERIAYLDFGIVGRLDPDERRKVASVLDAIVCGDPARALEASEGLGLRVPDDRRSRLEHDLAGLMRRTLAQSHDVRHFGVGLLRLLSRHRVGIPAGYGLLVKALVTVEGVARALYPQIDIIDTARPFSAALTAQGRLYSSARTALRLPER